MKRLISIFFVLFSLLMVNSQTKKKKPTTTTLKTCNYCSKKFNKNNGYVVPLQTLSASLYKVEMENISLARSGGYPEQNLKILINAINNGKYFCSQNCVYLSGYKIVE